MVLLMVTHLLVLLARIGSYSFELQLEFVDHVFSAHHLLHLLLRRVIAALGFLQVGRLLLLQAFIVIARSIDGCR